MEILIIATPAICPYCLQFQPLCILLLLPSGSSRQSVTIARGDGFRCESARIVSLISYDSNRRSRVRFRMEKRFFWGIYSLGSKRRRGGSCREWFGFEFSFLLLLAIIILHCLQLIKFEKLRFNLKNEFYLIGRIWIVKFQSGEFYLPIQLITIL